MRQSIFFVLSKEKGPTRNGVSLFLSFGRIEFMNYCQQILDMFLHIHAVVNLFMISPSFSKTNEISAKLFTGCFYSGLAISLGYGILMYCIIEKEQEGTPYE